MGHPVLLSNSLHLDQLSNRPAWIFFCGPTLLVAFAKLCGHVLAVHAVVAKLAAFAVNQSKGYRLKLDFNYAQSKRYRLKIDFNYAQSKGYRLKLEFNRKWNRSWNLRANAAPKLPRDSALPADQKKEKYRRPAGWGSPELSRRTAETSRVRRIWFRLD